MKIIVKEKSVLKIFFYGILLLFASYNIISNNFSEESNRIVAITVLALSVYLVIAYRNNLMLFIIYFAVFFFNYSIAIPVYLYSEDVFIFHLISDLRIRGIGINILLVFMILLVIFKKSNKNHKIINTNIFLINNPKNILVTSTLFIFLIFIFLLALSGIGIGPIYEYSIILFILGFYYSGDSKLIKSLFTILLCCFCLLTFINGDRVSVLQMLIAYFILLFNKKVTYKSMIPVIFIGIIFMTFLGVLGDGISLSNLSFENIIKILENRFFALDTAYSAFFTSLTFISVKDIVSFSTEIGLFVNFLVSMVLGGSLVENSSLPLFTRTYMVHYNGGILPIYFYFYLGWLGILISAILLSFYTRKIQNLNEKSSAYSKLVLLYITATVPRWYLYSPSSLIRGVLVFSLVYYLMYFINSRLKLNKKKHLYNIKI